jgi:hypothetical protein
MIEGRAKVAWLGVTDPQANASSAAPARMLDVKDLQIMRRPPAPPRITAGPFVRPPSDDPVNSDFATGAAIKAHSREELSESHAGTG